MTTPETAYGFHGTVHAGGLTFHVDAWSGQTLRIDVGARHRWFDFSDQFGPLFVSKEGRPLERQDTGVFLRAAILWALQGRRTEGDRAIWHEPRKPVLEHLGGRHYRVIESGEVGHDW